MKRRNFLKLGGIISIALVSGVKLFGAVLPAKFIEAVRGGRYPGKIKPLNRTKITKQGEWEG